MNGKCPRNGSLAGRRSNEGSQNGAQVVVHFAVVGAQVVDPLVGRLDPLAKVVAGIVDPLVGGPVRIVNPFAEVVAGIVDPLTDQRVRLAVLAHEQSNQAAESTDDRDDAADERPSLHRLIVGRIGNPVKGLRGGTKRVRRWHARLRVEHNEPGG